MSSNFELRRVALAALVTVGAVTLNGCARNSDAQEASEPSANAGVNASASATSRALVLDSGDVAVVSLVEIGDAITLAGPLEPGETVTLRAQVPGTITGLTVDRGASVRRGQRLATIRAAGVMSQVAGTRAGVAAAEAQVTVARKQMEGARALYDAGAISLIERQSAEASHEAAVAQLAAARAQETNAGEAAGFTNIVAPLDGVVSVRQRENGESVSSGDEILTVVDPRTLELAGRIGVGDASRVRVGQPVRFTLDAIPGRTFDGRVARIDPVADAGTRQVGVYVTLPNRDRAIVGGQYARGLIALGASQALVVPATAVRGIAGADSASAHVYVIEQGRLSRRAITLGARDDRTGAIAITSGLREGDRVIATPTPDVTDGLSVQMRSDKR